MAEAVEKRHELEPAPASPRRRSAVYGMRFNLAYLLVVLAFGAVILLFAYLVSRSSDSQPWSGYRPGGEGITRAQNIANHVAPRYLQGGQPIAVVEAQPPIISDTYVDGIAVAKAKSSDIGGEYEGFESAEGTILYVFCGLGEGCSLPSPSLETGQLLRRESLELALYTFKYMDDVKAVVTLLPPEGTEDERTIPAVYLRRRTVENQLKKPLHMTLSTSGTFAPDRVPNAETSERLTESRFFSSEFQRLPNERIVLVLTKPPRR